MNYTHWMSIDTQQKNTRGMLLIQPMVIKLTEHLPTYYISLGSRIYG